MRTQTAYADDWVNDMLDPTTSGWSGALAKEKMSMCDAYYILFGTGTKLFLTNSQIAFSSYNDPYAFLPDNGFTVNYVPALIQRGPVRSKIGLEVDELDLTIHDLALVIDGKPLLEAWHAGSFDNCKIRLYVCLLFPSGGAPQQRYVRVNPLMFQGRVSDGEADYEGLRLKVRSEVELLNIRMPRHVYQPGCQHSLFDAKCGLTKASFGSAGTAASGSTTVLVNSAHAQAAGYFDLGTLEFTAGANAGVKRSVKAYTPGVFVLSNPLPNTPTVGDAFTAYPGCDKRQATCTTKFSNLANHRAFPYVPTPETAY